MPKVLIVSSRDLQPELGETILWRSDIERVFVPNHEAALAAARDVAPNMTVVDGGDAGAVLGFITRLRGNDETRNCSVTVLSRSISLADEEALRRAGANAVFSGRLDPFLWDDRLEELLCVPPRRSLRTVVQSQVWSHFASEEEPVEGLGLNISVRGLLLETNDPIDLGTKLDLTFTLPPDERRLAAVGQVVREAPVENARPRSGVEFLILRGDARDRIRAFVESRTQ